MLMHEIPSRPWAIVASDLFHWHDQWWFLVLVDSYSGWIEMNSLNTLTSKEVINKMRPHFARWGTPRVLQSDNGNISREFADFAVTWGFNHATTSPTYSQSNGLAKNWVKIAKSILEKAWRSGADPTDVSAVSTEHTERQCDRQSSRASTVAKTINSAAYDASRSEARTRQRNSI